MSFHNAMSSTDIHVMHAFTYADAASRTAAIGLQSTDIGKIAKQTDTSRFYILTNHSPVTWSEVTAPSNGGGGINYVSNPNGEDSTAGWATYADAAATSPVDGIGGSPVLTLTRSATNPLRGTASFLLTKDAANRQGNGASYDFTIDRADLAKVLEVTVDIEPTTGFVASSGVVGNDSDIEWYMYDVTNAALIPLSSKVITTGVGVQSTFRGVFQTASNSSSYRLIAHVATTNATAWTFKFDNVRVGPPSMTQGTPISDWVTYTPTGTWSANTTWTGAWRRVGDSMQVRMTASLTGAPTGTFTANLPTGYTIDTTKMGSHTIANNNFGYGAILGASTAQGPVTVGMSSTTALSAWTLPDGSGAAAEFTAVTATSPRTFASGDWVEINAFLPIVGWSSNVQMSQDTDTRVVAFQVNQASPTATITGTPSLLKFTSGVAQDTHGAFSTSTGFYTVPVSGFYRVSMSVGIAGTMNVNSDARLYIAKNSSTVTGTVVVAASSSQTSIFGVVATTVFCTAGDTLAPFIAHDSITSPTINANASFNFFNVERISGPASIAATESVNAYYLTTAGQSITTASNPIVNFDTKVYDSHNAVAVGGSWVFTAPIAGKYRVSSTVSFANSAWSANPIVSLAVNKNGSLWAKLMVFKVQAAFTDNIVVTGSTTIQVSAGDTINMHIDQNSGGSKSLETGAGYNWIAIERIGN